MRGAALTAQGYKSTVGGFPWHAFLVAPPPRSSPLSFLSPSPPGSSDEDEDEDGVSAAAFLKKKSEAPSGESRKFLKKMEVRARARLRSVICLPWTILRFLGRRRLSEP